jgi:hypothetical protein
LAKIRPIWSHNSRLIFVQTRPWVTDQINLARNWDQHRITAWHFKTRRLKQVLNQIYEKEICLNERGVGSVTKTGWENYHATEKSEAIARCKEIPVIPVNKMVNQKRMIGKGAQEKERHEGSWITTPAVKILNAKNAMQCVF